MLNLIYPAFLKDRAALGLLALRLVVGGAFIFHGLFKLQFSPFGWMGATAPVPGILQFAAAFSEFAGGILTVLGLFSPLAALMLIGTMTGALALVHIPMGHPFVNADPSKPAFELALTYLISAVTVLLAGPGAYSLDNFLFNRKSVPAKAAWATETAK